MLNQFVQFSLRYRGVVIALACLLIGYGLYVAAHAKLDVFPEFVQPQVTIQTESPGLAAEQVEALVTRAVEGVVNGAASLESMRSESIQGLSVVTVVFKEGTDIYIARQGLAERLAELSGELPAGVKSPKMEQLTSSTMDLLKFGLVSQKLSPMDLRTFAEWTVRPAVLAVPGVARVTVFGGETRQLQIQVKPDRLIAYELALQDVLAAARNSTGVRGAGFIETAQQRITIQTEGQALTAAELGEVVVTSRDSRPVRLKDVATVVEAAEPKFGDALIQGEPGILITMSGQYGANTMEVTEAVEQVLEQMKPTFDAQGIKLYARLHRPATFIENAIRNVKSSLLLGAGLVSVVLFLFLLDLRTALISFSAIPLSLLAAVIVLNRFGATINTITLGGFAVAIGVVVDDAIIDVENILRRLRENSGLATPRSLFQVVLEASLEVRSAVVYATFIVAMVFLPVLMMSGVSGRFFAPLGTAFILAILASLIVALTVTPALCFALFSRAKPHREVAYIRWLKEGHRRALKLLTGYPVALIVVALLLFAASLMTLRKFGGELLPDFREGHFVLQVSAAPGTSLPRMLELGARISRELLQNTQHIATVEQQLGRAEMGEDTWGSHRTEFHVELKPMPAEEEESVQAEIRKTLGAYPGIQFEVLTFLGDRLGETISGETAPIVVNIFGDDLDALDEKAREVKDALAGVPGATDAQVQSPPGSPRLTVRLRPDRLTAFGFTPVEVLEAVETAYQGATVAQSYLGARVFDVAVILAPENRRDPETIGALIVRNSQGTRVPLHELAEISLTTGRYAILHDGARRRQTITCGAQGRDVASVAAAAKAKIAATVKFPPGVYPAYSGAAEEQARARQELLLHSVIAGVGIVLLLAILFRSVNNLLLVLANLPFALVGGVLAAYLTGASLSIGSLVGFVTLFGITMRNSIMMISHYEHLVQQEGMTWGLETVLRGASERLLPILMTALVTALGLLPLAIGTGEAGREIEGPMAIVILGGLITSTLLNLLVLPTLALRYARFPQSAAES